MARRQFRLPREEQLSKEQDRILALPEDGQFLVVGGPGTGKSVVALLRAMKYHRPGYYRFLTYNRVLHAATEQLADFLGAEDSMTIHRWFYRTYQNIFGENEHPPQYKAYDYDYGKIIEKFRQLNGHQNRTYAFHIIIDEGQDMPIGFYETLMQFGLENFFIVADQNQQITSLNSSRQELMDALSLEIEDVFELTQNYRNTRPIAAFAGHFYTDKASPLPILPERFSQDTPILFEYEHYHECIRLILREADRNTSRLIGVIVANNKLREHYFNELQSFLLDLDNLRPPVSTYPDFVDNGNVNIVFSQGGIVVLNAASVKGIEFDVVFVLLDGFKVFDEDEMKKKLYVMTSRAIEKLVLLKSTHYQGGVDKLLPEDGKLMRYEKLISRPVGEDSESEFNDIPF